MFALDLSTLFFTLLLIAIGYFIYRLYNSKKKQGSGKEIDRNLSESKLNKYLNFFKVKDKYLNKGNAITDKKSNTDLNDKDLIIELMKKIEEHDGKIKKQEDKIKKQDDKIKNQEDKIKMQDDKIKNQEDKIKMQDDKNKNQEDKINSQIVESIIQKININMLIRKYDLLLNSYQVLYFRKIANILLDIILKKYNNFFVKTEKIFIDSKRPKDLQRKFAVILASQKINEIKKNDINLFLDFLMFVKESTSAIIHLAEKYDIQIEILFSIFDPKKIEKVDNGNYYVEPKELLNIFFGIKNDIEKKKKIPKSKGSMKYWTLM